MNCEICKSKKATLFYADEGGIRHALCAACGDSVGRLGSVREQKKQPPKYIPEPSLCSFLERKSDVSLYLCDDGRPRAACPTCESTLDSIISSGQFGCPLCYESFEDSLKLRYVSAPDTKGVRMPSSRRSDIDRQAMLKSLKSDLKSAVEAENFELAASLRDKIKKLEAYSKNA